MCAGEGKRWNKEYPKQMALVEGVPNLNRIHNMIIENGFSKENIFVTVNSENKRYFPSDLNMITGSSSREIDRFRNAFTLMQDYERIVFLYGDTIYHHNDMRTILFLTYDPKLNILNKLKPQFSFFAPFLYNICYLSDNFTSKVKSNCYTFFGSSYENSITGKSYRELFAISITDKERFIDDVNKVALDFENGNINRETGWQIYDSQYHKKYKRFIELSAYTDDYDSFSEYENITKCLFGE
jgi:hypothetical protein